MWVRGPLQALQCCLLIGQVTFGVDAYLHGALHLGGWQTADSWMIFSRSKIKLSPSGLPRGALMTWTASGFGFLFLGSRQTWGRQIYQLASCSVVKTALGWWNTVEISDTKWIIRMFTDPMGISGVGFCFKYTAYIYKIHEIPLSADKSSMEGHPLDWRLAF